MELFFHASLAKAGQAHSLLSIRHRLLPVTPFIWRVLNHGFSTSSMTKISREIWKSRTGKLTLMAEVKASRRTTSPIVPAYSPRAFGISSPWIGGDIESASDWGGVINGVVSIPATVCHFESSNSLSPNSIVFGSGRIRKERAMRSQTDRTVEKFESVSGCQREWWILCMSGVTMTSRNQWSNRPSEISA